MKKELRIALAALCGAALLSGCGNSAANDPTPGNSTEPDVSVTATPDAGETGTPEEHSYTLEEIRTANSMEALLKNHDSIAYTQEVYQGDAEEPISTATGVFYKKDGFYNMLVEYADPSGSSYCMQGYADNVYAGALYSTSTDGEKFVTLYDAGSYDEAVDLMWATTPAVEAVSVTVEESTWQDGAAIVRVRSEYGNTADMYEETYYYIEPESGELIYMETSSYALDGSVIAVNKITFSFDGDYTFASQPFAEIAEGTDYCEVNLILNPLEEDMEVHWYPIAHGTAVYFTSMSASYTLYDDEELTHEITAADIDTNKDVVNIFAVRSK